MTRLCVAIVVQSLEQALSDATVAAEHGADLVEFRVDSFTELAAVAELVKRSPIGCIVTCRPTWEGGQCELTDQERIPVLETASLAGAAYIDVELAAYRRSANLRQKVHFNAGSPIDQTAPRTDRKGLIVSSHDFQSRPVRLNNLVAELHGSGGDVSKIVWTARTVRDNLEAFEILRHSNKPTIALCMGEAGLISRVLAAKFGAFLTFAALREGTGTAPGQVSLREMLEVYRFRLIGRETAVYGVVGHPVSHSLSPHVHNTAFERERMDAVYLPMPVEAGYESFKAFMETFARDEQVGLRGLSITLPHKENACRYLQEVGGEMTEVAKAAGAVNTIAIDRSASAVRFRGTSTDHGAILACVRRGLGRDELTGVEVAVLGAGGTGRTAVGALVRAGAVVTIYNRSPERAEALAQEFGARALPLSALPESDARVFVQTTSVGMSPRSEASAWGERPPRLGRGTVAFDTVYTPMTTTFLKTAAATGATTVQGIEMFAHQAAAQFEFWTGKVVSPEIFRARAEEELVYRGLS
jgi:3-dehydroquinate dehydratase/shikimate dehydrogenase